ncbi:hypothetical protein AGMMS5026_05610 [Endomicrobiia bacterium]|nr:hypothetical protein AGMMS5026_05610 [Endomicrobiia bacterium]
MNKYSTFRKLDVQTFIKDLRDYLSYHRNLKIRCFYCGEYGNILDRPHYHITVYGLSADYSPKTISRITKDYNKWGYF